MSEFHPEGDIERRLSQLRGRVSFPSTPALMPAVRDRLPTIPPRRRWPTGTRFRVVALAILIAALLAALLTPPSRTALARFFGVAGVSVTRGPLPPGPLGHSLALGARVSLDTARAEAPFRLLLPSVSYLGQPDEVYLSTLHVDSAGGVREVTMLYRSRPGLPRASWTGTGLLLTEFRAGIYVPLLRKVLDPSTLLNEVRVGSEPGYFIHGAPHVLYFEAPGGFLRDHARLAGNTLLWSQGGITIRLESALNESRSIRIAVSLR